MLGENLRLGIPGPPQKFFGGTILFLLLDINIHGPGLNVGCGNM